MVQQINHKDKPKAHNEKSFIFSNKIGSIGMLKCYIMKRHINATNLLEDGLGCGLVHHAVEPRLALGVLHHILLGQQPGLCGKR